MKYRVPPTSLSCVPPDVLAILQWIAAAGLLAEAVRTVSGKYADDAFLDLHALLIEKHLCDEAMRLMDRLDESGCSSLVNALVLHSQ